MSLLLTPLGPVRAARLAYGYANRDTRAHGVFVLDLPTLEKHKVVSRLWPSGGVFGDYEVKWSPDGRALALSGAVKEARDGNIFTVDPDGGHTKKLTHYDTCFGAVEPEWSPNSRRVLYRHDSCEQGLLYIMNRNGSHKSHVSRGFDHVWSPDGKKVSFTRNSHYRTRIWVSDPDGSNIVDLTARDADEWDLHPRFSPDGERVLYTGHYTRKKGHYFVSGQTAEVCVVRVDGFGGRCLTHAEGDDSGAEYSPSGKRIVFTSHRNGNQDLFVMTSDGRREHAIVSSKYQDFDPVWSPGGKWIAFLRKRHGQTDIYAVRPNGKHLRRLTSTPGDEEEPAWSPSSA